MNKVWNILKFTMGFTLGNKRFHIGLAYPFNRSECIENLIVFYAELVAWGIDVRLHNLDAHFAAFFFEKLQFVGVYHIHGHGSTHKLYGIMGFEVCGLIWNKRICGSVWLVETIRCKLFHLVKNGSRGIPFYTIFDSSFRKNYTVFDHFLFDFFTHGFTEFISTA